MKEFQTYYIFGTFENPTYVVKPIAGGYEFTIVTAGAKQGFTLSSAKVHDSSKDLNLFREQEIAVELFRDFGKNKWPDLFH